jgi:phage terminase Nu1 subunit (DNA packaging protein)
MGKVVNKRELSEILGASEAALTEWQRIGMPMLLDADRGHSNSYDTEAVIRW